MSNAELIAWQKKSKKQKQNSKTNLHRMIVALNKNLKHNNIILNEMKDSMRCFKVATNCRVVPFESNPVSKQSDNESLYNNCTQKVPISIRICFTRIGEVDTIKETFEAEAVVETKWTDLNLKEEVILC